MAVVATAGHVDHGKSSLVLALTGTDPDRWDEEKARGLTIDLGFALAVTPQRHEVELVDVPGHIRFIKNMLAGVGAVRSCLFVVAATEGWKPQSEEHLRILDLLGVDHGVVAVTKAEPAGPERTAAVAADVAQRLRDTALAGSEIVAVDSLSGAGIGSLWEALDRLLAAAPEAADRERPRLWVDRAFSARGSGTVVTGTLIDGGISVGDEVEVAGRRARVRGLQRQGRGVDSAGPGHRVAVNLAGIGHRDVGRGDAVTFPGQWHHTRTFDAHLVALGSLSHPVTRRGAYVAHIGSGEHPVALRVLGPGSIEPGSSSPVRIHLARPLPLLPGDRFVLRDLGRRETVGGGEVLDVDPVLPASRARPDRDVDRVVRERGWVRAGDLARLTGVARPADVGEWVVDPDELRRATEELSAAAAAAGVEGLDVSRLDDRQRALLATVPGIEVAAGRARPVGMAPATANHPYLARLAASPFAPPPPDGVDRAALRRLVSEGLVVESDGIHFAADAVDEAARTVARLLASQPEGITASEARAAWGTSRKFALPLLAALDRSGVTRRRGEVRIGGPRLPKVD